MSSNPNDFDFESNFDLNDLDDMPDLSATDLGRDDDLFPDDDPVVDDSGGGMSRTFLLLLAGLAVIFVILVAVVVAIAIGGGDSCNDNCKLATQITGQNQTIEADIRSSETSQSVQSTETSVAVATLDAQSTEVAQQQSTATQDTVNTAVASTQTQQSVDATTTQAAIETDIAATQAQLTLEAVTDTPVPVAASEQQAQILDVLGNPVPAGVTVCIFRDNGDGQFNPGVNNNTDCSPTLGVGGGGGDTTGNNTIAEPTTEAPVAQPTVQVNSIFQTATANAAGVTGGSDTTTGSDTTGSQPTIEPTSPLNSIFQTATANAAGALGVPTAEGSSRKGIVLARAISRPDQNAAPQQQGDDDAFVDGIVTDANGNISIPNLPPGDYWFTIGSESFNINVTETAGDQVFNFPRTDGSGSFTVTVRVDPNRFVATPTQASNIGGPESCTSSPIFCTATKLAEGQLTPSVEVVATEGAGTPTKLADTGLFDGKGDDVSSVDLLILGLIGMVLVGVVFAARRMRTTV